MRKTLYARCIRRWEVRTKFWCDSKWNEVWGKRHKKYFREAAVATADCMIDRLAEDLVWRVCPVADERGWTSEFSKWYDERREQYQKTAREHLDKEAATDQIDEEIEDELEA